MRFREIFVRCTSLKHFCGAKLFGIDGATARQLVREWSPEVGRGESKHPSLPLARAERKPLGQKKKPAPRYQRENQLKEKTNSASGPRGAQAA